MIILPPDNTFISSFPILIPLIPFFFLKALIMSSSTMLSTGSNTVIIFSKDGNKNISQLTYSSKTVSLILLPMICRVSVLFP